MPKAKKQPVLPVQLVVQETPPTILPLSSENGPPIVYEKLEVTEFSTAVERGPLTVEEIHDLMGLETEKEYQKRKVEEKGGELAHYLYGEDYHCKNLAGEKVRARNNLNNRPFDESWCYDLAHTIICGQWAGPHTIPGETINGETIRISKYGRVISGQHQMTACWLANQTLAKARLDGVDSPAAPKYPTWTKHGHVFLETIVVTGMSEDPRVLMTVDYVKPRSVADVFYTSSTYMEIIEPDGKVRKTTNQERQELCRILERAVDFLRTRTADKGYRTHIEAVGFLERHPRLLDCVLHLFNLNRATKLGGRKISNLRLSPGQCAALMYIMGSSGPKTDGDEYRNMDPAPSEKNEKGKNAFDWSYWDKSVEFWALLATTNDPNFRHVTKALGQLITSTADSEDNQGMGGRLPERLAIVSKAWERWKDHPDTAGAAFDESDLRPPDGCLALNYVDCDATGKELPDGVIELVDIADFMGIDCPKASGRVATNAGDGDGPPIQYTNEEMEKMCEEADARREVNHPCQVCKGKGCDRCNHTGRKDG